MEQHIYIFKTHYGTITKENAIVSQGKMECLVTCLNYKISGFEGVIPIRTDLLMVLTYNLNMIQLIILDLKLLLFRIW